MGGGGVGDLCPVNVEQKIHKTIVLQISPDPLQVSESGTVCKLPPLQNMLCRPCSQSKTDSAGTSIFFMNKKTDCYKSLL